MLELAEVKSRGVILRSKEKEIGGRKMHKIFFQEKY